MHNFNLTPSITDKILKIGILYGRISALSHDAPWMERLSNFIKFQSGIAAVSIDKNVFDRINLFLLQNTTGLEKVFPPTVLKDLKSYFKAKEDIAKKDKHVYLSLELLNKTHSIIMNHKGESTLRKSKRLLPKQITENGIVKSVTLEVLTLPQQIPQKLQNYIDWFEAHVQNFNPIVLAAITHFRIAEIHPYDDGNGRLCRLLDYFALAKGDMDVYNIVSLEHYFLTHSERYYQLLEAAISSQNLTDWIEFYTDALLSSILGTTKTIAKLTGGAIDIKNNIVHELSDLELKIIDLMRSHEHSTPLQMAKTLGYSKQNICRILRLLSDKGLIQKTGQNTGVRYSLL